MKRTAISLICPLVIGILMTSCLGDAEESELSSAVALTSFSISDLKTTHVIKKENGEDSTYTTVVSGKTIAFTIDQTNELVYNTDSIAYGTDLTHVTVSVGSDGYACYLKEDGEAGSVEDSIDFTHPVTFRITSYDEQFSRDYRVSVNVHQIDPKETTWRQFIDTNYPKELFVSQKAIIKGDSLFAIGKSAEGICYSTSTALSDGATWSAPTALTNIIGEVDCTSLMLINDTFYLLADGALYHSTDAITWAATNNTKAITTLLAVEKEGADAMVWGLVGDSLAASNDMGTWNFNGQQITQKIKERIASFSHSLPTNSSIHRTIFITTPATETDTCAQVWSKLTTENNWVEVKPQETNIYGCPNLKNLAIIQYADKMYAFGGKSIGPRKASIEAFSACYESRDNGVTWKVRDDAFSMPEAFKGRNESFTAATDGEYVWVMWSTTGQVWRGRWNGL